MKTVLITGTTSGIGAAFSQIFAKKGWHVILIARNRKKLYLQQKKLKNKRNRIDFIVMDLAQPHAAAEIYEQIKKRGWHIDVLINNAGFNEYGLFAESNIQKEQDIINLHIQFNTEMMKLFLPAMIKKGRGRVLNVVSTSAFIPSPKEGVYSASKAYLLSLSYALNKELDSSGISVTALCPGATKTSFAKKSNVENTHLYRHFVMDAHRVAKYGYKAMVQGKCLAVPGVLPKLQVIGGKIFPYAFVGPIASYIWSKPKHES